MFKGFIKIECQDENLTIVRSHGAYLSKRVIRDFYSETVIDFNRVRVEWTSNEYRLMADWPGTSFWGIERANMREAFDKGYIRVVEQD